MRTIPCFSLALLIALPVAAATPAAEDPTAVLRAKTQALMNAITTGSSEVWQRALDEKATMTDEGGGVTGKAEMVKSIHPLAAGVSGSIDVIDFKAYSHGSVAVTNYVSDEHEDYHGHALHCQYRSTDTWLRSGGEWHLLASQVLALRTDPPGALLAPEKAADYVGRYALTPAISYEIRLQAGQLEGKRSDRPKGEALVAESPDVFFIPGQPRYRTIFQRDAQGKITGFVERREAWDIAWTRIATE
jgi:hypothetical protein